MAWLLSVGDSVTIDPFTLLSDGSTIVVAAVVVLAAFKFYNFLRTNEREDRDVTDHRLDRLRQNNTALMQYAGRISRLVPPEIELPQFPELLPEIDDE